MSRRELEARRVALIAEIHAAFDGVSREGGVSWSQSYLHDHGVRPYTSRDYREAGEKDRDKKWQELIESTAWEPHPSWGGFNFLDAIGFRYYIAPAMIRMLTDPDSEVLFPGTLEQVSARRLALLNVRQCRCIAMYVAWMIDSALESGSGLALASYERAMEYWRRFTHGQVPD